MEDADSLEFQRVHRIGYITQLLRYPNREEALSNARKLKGKGRVALAATDKKVQ